MFSHQSLAWQKRQTTDRFD